MESEQQDAPVIDEPSPSSASSSRRAAAQRRQKGKHLSPVPQARRPAFWTALTVLSAAVLIALMLAAVSGLTRENAFRRMMEADQADTLPDGLSIDGVPVGGYAPEKAKALLASPHDAETAFEYRIHVQNRVWFMTHNDLPIGSDIDTLITQAQAYSRRLALSPGETVSSPFEARAGLREKIRTEGLALSSMTGYEVTDIARYVDGLAEAVDREPVNAALVSMDFSRREFNFSDDIPGVTLDREALIRDIADCLNAGKTDADITAKVTSVPAAITRLRLKNSFGCLEVRNFRTDTPAGDGKVQEYTAAVNGIMFRSGETVGLRGLLGNDISEGDQAAADRFATAVFDAGVCAGLKLAERAPLESAPPETRGLEAHLDADHDLKLTNTAQTPLCVLCYYTPLNGRGTRGSVTLEVYGVLRQGGETAEIAAETVETYPAGSPEYRVNPELEPGTTLLRREARDGAKVNTLLVRKVNGKTYSSDIICSAVYPPACRLIETGP